MTTTDIENAVRLLIESNDSDLEMVGKSAKALFFDSADAPPRETIERLQSIQNTVLTCFPTPFADMFASWTESRKELEAVDRDASEALFKRRYMPWFEEIWGCWRQIVRFLPFVLLVALVRLPKALEEKGGETLLAACEYYESYYRQRQAGQSGFLQYEIDQRMFLTELINLCYLLNRDPGLPDSFFFNPLLGEIRDFARAFPKRFTAELEFIQFYRNRVHGEIARRAPRYLEALRVLVEVAFLDIIETIAPLARSYGIYYVASVDRSATPPVASAWSFAGLQGRQAHFHVSSADEPSADVDRFAPKQIYMVDRNKEIENDALAPDLRPPDYIDLTPFIIDMRRLGPSRAIGGPRLFALRRYQPEERDPFIAFLELGGGGEERLPRAQAPTEEERRELEDMLPELERLAKFVRGMAEYVRKERIGSMNFAGVRERAWDRVSKEHLRDYLDVTRVTSTGKDAKDTSGKRATAAERQLYVEPAQGAIVDEFFASSKRGLFLVGGSGYGKTTLLVQKYLDRLRAGDVAFFLTGRKLPKPSLREILGDVAGLLAYECSPLDLVDFVANENVARRKSGDPTSQITIFIDAVNEFTAGSGAISLLREIVEFVQTGGDAMFPKPLANVRIVATCRSETWSGFRDADGKSRLLDARFFSCDANGDAFVVDGFGDDASRTALYERYRDFYRLLPVKYADLPREARDLFSVPLLVSLVAQTYGGLGGGKAGVIPRDLSYFDLFRKLKERKLHDAQFLIAAGDRRAGFAAKLADCIFAFAEALYARMTQAADPRDYLENALTDREPLGTFKADRPDRELTEFRALLEIGLTTRKMVTELDYHKNETLGRAYTFFHDRYAEYELATVYEARVLGSLVMRAPAKPNLDAIVSELERLAERGIGLPVLLGAVEHWFHIQLRASRGKVQTLLPLCRKMVEQENASVRAMAGEILTRLVVRGVVSAEELYKAAFAQGSRRLKDDLAAAYADAWPGIDSGSVRTFLDTCDPQLDESTICALADVFVEHGNAGRKDADGLTAVGFVAKVFPGLLSALRFGQFKSHLAFLVHFSEMLIVTNLERPELLLELRAFLRRQFGPVLYVVTGKTTGNPVVDLIPGRAHALLRQVFERSMLAGWDDGASCGGVNDTFFVEDRGLVQREVMERYVPSMCALHNGDFSELSLAPGSPFRELVLTMLSYRQYSIIGFAAYVVVAVALRNDDAAAADIALELSRNESPAGRFIAVNVIENYCLLNPSFSVEALRLVADDMLPYVLDDALALPHLLICAAGIVEGRIDELWPHLEPALDRAFAYVLSTGGDDAKLDFCREMRCMAFFASAEIGTRMVDYLLRRGYLENESRWFAGSLEICAGLATRSRSELTRLLTQYGVDELVLREAQALRTQEVLDQQRTFGARARWNIFFAKTLASNKKLRYLLIKYMLGPLARCNSVEEWSKQMGTFIIESIRAYAEDDEDPSAYDVITVEEIEKATPFQPKPGKGVRYVSRR